METPIIRPGSEWSSGEWGIYQGVPEEEYHSGTECSNSQLGKLRQSPRHLQKYRQDGMVPTRAMKQGSVADTLLFTPDTFPAIYMVSPQCAARTTKGAQCSKTAVDVWDATPLCGTHAPKDAEGERLEPDEDAPVIVTDAMVKTAQEMIEALPTYPEARVLLHESAEYQLSMRFPFGPLKIPMRVRLDAWVRQHGAIVDYKGSGNASADSFRLQLRKLGRSTQAAIYEAAVKFFGMPVSAFIFLVQEFSDPYVVGAYRLDPPDVEAGMIEARRLAAQWKECIETGVYHGYTGGRIQTLTMRKWDYDESLGEEGELYA